MEDYAVFLVQSANEVAHLWAENALHRPRLGRDHVNVKPSRPQGGGNLEPDEARADHHGAACRFGAFDDGSAIGQRA